MIKTGLGQVTRLVTIDCAAGRAFILILDEMQAFLSKRMQFQISKFVSDVAWSRKNQSLFVWLLVGVCPVPDLSCPEWIGKIQNRCQ